MASPIQHLRELKLTSLQELSFSASAQPYDTFWRAADKALVTFETLQVIPEGERVQYRIKTADTCETVLANVQRLGRKRLAGNGRGQIERISNIMTQLKTHARSEADFEHDLTALRQIIKERPGGVVGARTNKNVCTNTGSLYGMNLGDGGSVSFGAPVQKCEDRIERNEDNAETGKKTEDEGVEQLNESSLRENEATKRPEDEPKVLDVPEEETKHAEKKGWLVWLYDLVMGH